MPKPVQAPGPDGVNMVAEGTVFEGTLRAAGDIRISGRLIGTIDVDGKLIVAPEGRVEGEVRAVQADVAGTVTARVDVEERLVLRSTAVVEGDITTGRFVVEEGAAYSGQCEMGTSRKKPLDDRGAPGRVDEVTPLENPQASAAS